MSPAQCRGFALDLLEAAEAADQDAALLRFMADMGLADQSKGQLLGALRQYRKDDDG